MAMSLLVDSNTSTRLLMAPGSRQSSESTNIIKSPQDCSSPTLRATDRPPFSWLIKVTRESDIMNSSAIRRVLSVEPSLTITTSMSWKDCARTLSRHSRKYSCTLYAGMIIETINLIVRQSKVLLGWVVFCVRDTPHH